MAVITPRAARPRLIRDRRKLRASTWNSHSAVLYKQTTLLTLAPSLSFFSPSQYSGEGFQLQVFRHRQLDSDLMLSRNLILLPSVVLSLIFELSWAQATEESFLGDILVRQNQVKNVLEHEPAKVPGCSHVVCRFILVE